MNICPACRQMLGGDSHFCHHCGKRLKDPWLGQKLGGRFVLRRFLGEGAFGVVYEADYEGGRIDRYKTLAVKIIKPELRENDRLVRRFIQEANVLVRLRHENIVEIVTCEEDDKTLFLVMELLNGITLRKLASKSTLPMSFERSMGIILQACEGVAVAHERGVLHRDLKPENLFIVSPGEQSETVKLLDFGIACILPGRAMTSDPEKRMTDSGGILGTPEHMSPEQIQGRVDERTDVYALGVILYEMLARRLPFEVHESDDGFYPMCMRKIQNPAPPLARSNPQLTLDPNFETYLCDRVLAKDSESRPATIMELKRRLKLFLEEFRHVDGAIVSAVTSGQAPALRTGAATLPTPTQRVTDEAIIYAPEPVGSTGTVEREGTGELEPEAEEGGSRRASAKRWSVGIGVGLLLGIVWMVMTGPPPFSPPDATVTTASSPPSVLPDAHLSPSPCKIESDPSGATIWTTNEPPEPRQTTPYSVQRPETGVLKLELRLKGYASKTIEIGANTGCGQPVKLAPCLTVKSNPPGARATDSKGRALGTTPEVNICPPQPGETYGLKRGNLIGKLVVRSPIEQPATQKITLRCRYRFTGTPPGADVVNHQTGEKICTTPCARWPGPGLEVEVIKEGFDMVMFTVGQCQTGDQYRLSTL